MQTLKIDASQLLQNLEQVNQSFIQNNAVYEEEAQNQLQELEQLSQFLTEKIEGEIVQRKEKENQLIQVMDKKLRSLKNDLEKEKKERTEFIEQITSTLKNDVPSLMNEVIDNSAARQQEEEKLAQIISGELEHCEEITKEFKEKQEESNTKIYGLIRDLTVKAKREIEEEKAVREETHEEILTYIEETCNKLTEN